MFVEEIRRAIAAAPRTELHRLSGAVWKAYAAGAIGEGEAQALAEVIEAKKAIPATVVARRRVGSRPRSSESMERRRRWSASGLMPPQIACLFTMGESAALAVIAAEVAKKGTCKLTLGHIAALAGVCKQTVRNAVRQAAALGILKSEEWRLSAFRSAPNTVKIVSPEWLSWLKLSRRSWGGSKTVERTPTNIQNKEKSSLFVAKGISGGGSAIFGPDGPDIGARDGSARHRPQASRANSLRSKG